jgi:uncharacterized protein (TIGR00290 family)
LQAGQYEVTCLLTSVNKEFQRISMHGVRTALLEKQAQHIGIPLLTMQLTEMPTMEVYENIMRATLTDLKNTGATTCVFGDIFLEDLHTYRETQLKAFGMKALFPLWKIPTAQLIQEFTDLGFKTIVTCVNEKYLDKSFAGRVIDNTFLKDLPENVDPCGENGEFHTFVFDGPFFKKPVLFKKGAIVYKKYLSPTQTHQPEDPFDTGFWYCDLLPA